MGLALSEDQALTSVANLNYYGPGPAYNERSVLPKIPDQDTLDIFRYQKTQMLQEHYVEMMKLSALSPYSEQTMVNPFIEPDMSAYEIEKRSFTREALPVLTTAGVIAGSVLLPGSGSLLSAAGSGLNTALNSPGDNPAVPYGARVPGENLGGNDMANLDFNSLINAIPGVLGAVGVTAKPGTGAGSLTGGQIVAQGRGYIVVQTPSGKRVTIQRKRHSRRARRSGGMGATFNQMMKYKMLKDMMK